MEQGKKRRVLVVVGSDSDVRSQCHFGFLALMAGVRNDLIEMVEGEVRTMSVHRNHDELVTLLKDLHERKAVDIIIAGAGWAAHLPGMIDAILNYELQNDTIHVIGVAFEDRKEPRHTEAAKLSISEVPGTRVVYGGNDGNFVGTLGFSHACQYAVCADFPALKISDARPSRVRGLIEAIDFCTEKLKT